METRIPRGQPSLPEPRLGVGNHPWSKSPSISLKALLRGRSQETKEAYMPIATPLGENLKKILADLDAVVADVEEYDRFFRAPTGYAVASMQTLLLQANKYVCNDFPIGAVYADGYGGLRLEWKQPGHKVRFAVPADAGGKMYLYHYSDMEEETNFSVSAQSLGYRLNWLNEWLTNILHRKQQVPPNSQPKLSFTGKR
jgi:hypothetical protein